MHKHLIIGPLPPPDGGTTILFKQLVDDLSKNDKIELLVINSNKYKNRFLKLLYIVYKFFNSLKKSNSVSFHCSTPLFRYFLPIIYTFAMLYKKPLVIRKFGGDYYNYIESNISLIDKVIIHILRKSAVSLFETKREVNLLIEEYNISNCIWYPNSRKKVSNKKVINLSNKTLKMCFIGAVSNEKGIDSILMALNDINNRNITIDIYGKCNDDKLLDSINLSKFSNYKGILSSDSIYEVLSSYDILCLPTRYKGEGYPGVIIEAYSVGIPVLVSNWQAIPEIVQDGIQGLVFDNSIDNLKEKIEYIYKNRELLSDFSKNAISSFALFDNEILSESYSDLIKKL
ncbi:TPA: glycosyltransferase family 4 protein [Photobacterium damselae]